MIELIMQSQPDDESCGPTSLYAIYQYYKHDISQETVFREVERSLSGGTLAPMLGVHALSQGFDVTIYINNLNIFDPTWFRLGKSDPDFIYKKLEEQMIHKRSPAIQLESKTYLKFLSLGGQICFSSLDVPLLKSYFKQKIPILTALSATYLYRCPRERFTRNGKSIFDDVKGTPCGHFVVLCGYDNHHRLIVVADPHRENPLSHDNYYKVSSHRLINAIMLGVTTYDANLLIIQPKKPFDNK